MDDGYRLRLGAAVVLGLHTGAGEGGRLLVGPLGDRQPLDADREPGVVHHGEHVGEAAAFLADQIAHRAAIVPEGHHAGRAAVDAELVLQRHAAQVVTLPGLAVGIDEELRHDEQRDAAHTCRRIRRTCQDEMDDVLGHIVLTVGDEDLLAGHEIVVATLHGAALELAEVGTRLGAP